MALTFEWDEHKARENLAKHGVGFPEAASSFGDPVSLTIDDPAHSDDEDRFIHLGTSYRNRLIVTALTERGDRIRIISARIATANERQQYDRRLPRQ